LILGSLRILSKIGIVFVIIPVVCLDLACLGCVAEITPQACLESDDGDDVD